jgi:DNA-binding NarL/FixJ family response regulator
MSQRILLVQNDALAAKNIIEALCQSSETHFQVEWVKRCSEGLEKVGGTEAILVDLYLPDSRGLATFDSFLAAAPGIPILVLIDPPDEATARRAVECGAQGYLFKTRLDARSLPKVLRSMIERSAYCEAPFAPLPKRPPPDAVSPD